MKGYSIGTVILIKIYQLLAPSTFAASNGSFGNEAKPPRQISNIRCPLQRVSTKIKKIMQLKVMPMLGAQNQVTS